MSWFHTPVSVRLLFLLCTAAYLPRVCASIYPTQPVQATVWPVDQPVSVSWIEDWKYPMLSQMGAVDVSLWRDTDKYLAPLASGVDPMTKTCRVTLPAWVLQQGSKYTLRFTTGKPIDVMIYSADFTLVPANTTTGAGADAGTGITGSDAVALATQSGTGTVSGTGFRTVLTSTGTGSTSTWTTTMTTTNANATVLSSVRSSLMPSGTPPPSGTTPGQGQGQGSRRTANAGRRGTMDVDKFKFRLVFVIWPVLMGVTMAW